jgi:single-strand DNA-binding protein
LQSIFEKNIKINKMSFKISGTLIAKFDTQVITDKFKKREFAIETRDANSQYSNYVKMQLVQAKCEMIDNFTIGDEISVSFDIRGNKWEKNGVTNYITNLDAWRIDKAGNEDNRANFNNAPAANAIPAANIVPDAPSDFTPDAPFDNDLPF